MNNVRPISINFKRFCLFIGLTFLLGLFIRFLGLDMKPPHFDEGINWFFTQALLTEGFYKYDPHNYHGPLHFYLLAIVDQLLAPEVWNYRLVTSFFSVLTCICLFYTRSLMGFTAVFATIFMLISPAFTFYARYAIHEAEFVFFLVLMIYGLVAMAQQKAHRGFWALMIGVTGCFLTKETVIIHLTAFVGIFVLLLLKKNLFVLKVCETAKTLPKIVYISSTALMLLTLCVFYTGFFQNLNGIRDFFTAYFFWITDKDKGLDTTGGHARPFYFFIDLLRRYEWPILLGLIASLGWILPVHSWSRYFQKMTKKSKKKLSRKKPSETSLKDSCLVFISAYGLLVFLGYSLIPYKTPWCLISMAWPFCFSAGYFVEKYVFLSSLPSLTSQWVWGFWRKTQNVSTSLIYFLLFFVVISVSIYQTISLNLVKYSDTFSHKYVYVQTKKDYWDFILRLKILVQNNPVALYKYPILVLAESKSYWPLPWALSHFSVSYIDLGFIENKENITIDIEKYPFMIIEGIYFDIFKRQIEKLIHQPNKTNTFTGVTYHSLDLNNAIAKPYVLVFSNSVFKDTSWWNKIVH